MKDKIYLVFDKTKNSLKIKSFLIKKIHSTTLKKSNVIIVLGGDGFMLQTLDPLRRLLLSMLDRVRRISVFEVRCRFFLISSQRPKSH